MWLIDTDESLFPGAIQVVCLTDGLIAQPGGCTYDGRCSGRRDIKNIPGISAYYHDNAADIIPFAEYYQTHAAFGSLVSLFDRAAVR